MYVTVNKKEMQLPDGMTVAELIKKRKCGKRQSGLTENSCFPRIMPAESFRKEIKSACCRFWPEAEKNDIFNNEYIF